MRLSFLNAGQSAYPKGWEGYRVVCSVDHQNWADWTPNLTAR